MVAQRSVMASMTSDDKQLSLLSSTLPPPRSIFISVYHLSSPFAAALPTRVPHPLCSFVLMRNISLLPVTCSYMLWPCSIQPNRTRFQFSFCQFCCAFYYVKLKPVFPPKSYSNMVSLLKPHPGWSCICRRNPSRRVSQSFLQQISLCQVILQVVDCCFLLLSCSDGHSSAAVPLYF